MKTLLLEQFWWLSAGCVTLWLVFLSGYYVRHTIHYKRAMVFSLPVFIVLLTLNVVIVTDREAIRTTLDELITACRSGDAAALEHLIADEFSADGLDKHELLNAADSVFDHIRIDAVRLTQVLVDPPALQGASISHILSQAGTDFGWVQSDWQLEFTKTADRWLLTSIRPLSIQLQNVNGIREVLQLGVSAR